MGIYLIFFGLLLSYTPFVMALMAGARSEEDAIQYFMNFPLDKLYLIMSMPNQGRGFIFVGWCLSIWERT